MSTKDEDRALLNVVRALVQSGKSDIVRKALETERVVIKRRPKVTRQFDPKWQHTFKECPHCGVTKVVHRGKTDAEDFGVRIQKGVERPQPWCRKCRNTANYHVKKD